MSVILQILLAVWVTQLLWFAVEVAVPLLAEALRDRRTRRLRA